MKSKLSNHDRSLNTPQSVYFNYLFIEDFKSLSLTIYSFTVYPMPRWQYVSCFISIYQIICSFNNYILFTFSWYFLVEFGINSQHTITLSYFILDSLTGDQICQLVRGQSPTKLWFLNIASTQMNLR